jgi:hypothetical protein
MFDIIRHLAHGVFHSLNEAAATGRHATQADHGIALGIIVGDDEHFAVLAETVRGVPGRAPPPSKKTVIGVPMVSW